MNITPTKEEEEALEILRKAYGGVIPDHDSRCARLTYDSGPYDIIRASPLLINIIRFAKISTQKEA